MDLIKYSKQTPDNQSIYYKILENGFDIYIGRTDKPTYHQPEPFIPYPQLNYEENALKMCEEFTIEQTPPFAITEDMYNKQQSDIDYLLLMSETPII